MFEDRPLKGYIRPKGNLNTPFTRDNIIDVNSMFSIAYFKKSVPKGICTGMYKTAIYSKKRFYIQPRRFIFENLRWVITYRFFQNLAGNEYCHVDCNSFTLLGGYRIWFWVTNI